MNYKHVLCRQSDRHLTSFYIEFMFNFLRRIRKSFLESGNIQKYLFYAAGEIFLVMIGILLALQVNNWNQDRLKQHEEVLLLQEIREGLADDLQDLQENRVMYGYAIDAIDSISETIDQDLPFHDSLPLFFSVSLFNPPFIKKEGPYETLKSKGMDMISNDDLRKSVISIYDAEFERITKYQNGYELDMNVFFEFLLNHFDVVEHGQVVNERLEIGQMILHDFDAL